MLPKPVIIPIQDNSDIKIECLVEDKLRNEKICNVSAPFMRAKTQVSHSNYLFFDNPPIIVLFIVEL